GRRICFGGEAQLRAALPDRARARPGRRALDAARRARARPRPQTLHRPPGQPARDRNQHPLRPTQTARTDRRPAASPARPTPRPPPPAASWVYELADRGRDLADIVLRLGRWGIRSPTFADVDAPARAEWSILALKARYKPDAASAAPTRIELRLGDDTYNLQPSDQGLSIERGTATDPDLVLALEPATLTALLRGQLRPRDAPPTGATNLPGTTAANERSLRLFT